MADLDLSQHSLNLSSSKMKYSFPKTKRFSESDRPLCDSLYGLPTTLTKRATMLGYGQKTMGINEKVTSPGVGTYQLESEINPEKNKNHSVTFGVSREKMEQGSPLGLLKFTSKIPAPTAYQAKDVHDYRAPSMRSRHPDHDFEKFIKNPGPGTYEHDHMGTNRYYLNSKYKNLTNGKISQVSRLEPISNKKPKVGPTDYQPIDTLNAAGRYSLAKHASVNSCVIPKAQRQGVVEKSHLHYPGPGQYNSFSSFG